MLDCLCESMSFILAFLCGATIYAGLFMWDYEFYAGLLCGTSVCGTVSFMLAFYVGAPFMLASMSFMLAFYMDYPIWLPCYVGLSLWWLVMWDYAHNCVYV